MSSSTSFRLLLEFAHTRLPASQSSQDSVSAEHSGAGSPEPAFHLEGHSPENAPAHTRVLLPQLDALTDLR